MTRNRHLRNAEYITNFLDTKFSLFGLKFGLDPLFDLIPFIGPLLSVGMSCYLLYIAYQFQLGMKVYIQMLINIALDYIIGLLPFIGIFGDVFFKANVRNIRLIRLYIPKSVEHGDIL